MAALQRAIWDEISRIAESYKSELQIAKSQEEFDRQAHGRGLPAVGDDAAIAGPPARAGDRGKYLSRHLRDLPVPLHSIGAAAILSFDRGPGRHGRHPSQPAEFAQDRPDDGAGDHPGIWPRHHGGVRPRADEPADSHPGAARKPAGHELPCGHTGVCGQKALRSAQASGRARNPSAFRQICEVAPFSATAEALRYIKVAIDLHPTGGKVIGSFQPSRAKEKRPWPAVSRPSWPRAGPHAADRRRSAQPIDDPDARLCRTRRDLLELVADKSSFADLVMTDSEIQVRLPAILDPNQAFQQLGYSELAGGEANVEERPQHDYDYVSSTCLRSCRWLTSGRWPICSMPSSWSSNGAAHRPRRS